jgi:hypothetical protein
LIQLSGTVKKDAKIDSLSFVPPLIHTGNPDFAEIRSLTAKALADSEGRPSASPSASAPSVTASPGPDSATADPRTRTGNPAAGPQTVSNSPGGPAARPVSLDSSCPS